MAGVHDGADQDDYSSDYSGSADLEDLSLSGLGDGLKGFNGGSFVQIGN